MIITYNNVQYVEQNVNNVVMSKFNCKCGNSLNIPLAMVVLGLTEDCGHCNYPLPDNHAVAITSSYQELLIDDSEDVLEL